MADFEVNTGGLADLARQFQSASIVGSQLGNVVRQFLIGNVSGAGGNLVRALDTALVRSSKALEPEHKKYGWRRGELVDIVTADDAHVCKYCRALAAGSPYPIEVARKQLPHHPGCRCKIVSQYYLGRSSLGRPLSRSGSRSRKGYLRWAKSKGHRLHKAKRRR